jgi:hypothetical protein
MITQLRRRACGPAAKSSVSAEFSSTQFVQQRAAQLIKTRRAAQDHLRHAVDRLVRGARTTAIADRLAEGPAFDRRLNHALANQHRSVCLAARQQRRFMVEDGGAVPTMFRNFAPSSARR